MSVKVRATQRHKQFTRAQPTAIGTHALKPLIVACHPAFNDLGQL
jgi:hypothetical protein